MATPILRYSPSEPALRTVTPPVVTTFTTETTEEETVNPGNPTPILEYHPSGGAPVPPWPPAPTDLTYPECGTIQLVSGQSWIDVTFANEKPDTNWIFEDLQVVNTTDPTYLNIWPGLVTVKSVTGFRVQLNGLPNTDNYFLHWAVGGCATSDWVVSPGITATNFLQLTDSPDDYAGQAGLGVKVNEAEDGLEFGVVGSGTSGDVINVLDYGAVADCVTLFDITMPNGNVVTSAAHTFVEADVGKWVIIRGATGGGISPLIGKITAVSGHTATLDTATTTALTNLHGATSYPRMDFGTDNTIPFVLACLAVPGPGQRWNFGSGVPFAPAGTMNPILPGDGGTVYIPRGNYLMVPIYPAGTGTSFWWLETNNLTLKGDGMGQTVIYTTSAGAQGPTLWGSLGGHGLFQNWTISDFTLYDLNYFNGNGNTLYVTMVDNLLIERVEINNSRGNGSINYQGYATGSTPINKRVTIKDCWVHGNQADSYAVGIANGIEGDGMNVGEVSDVHIENNRIEGPGRHAYEGGGNCFDQYFIGNTIDMMSGGLSGLNPTGGSTTVVLGNTIRNIVGGSYGVDFTVDVGPYFANDIRIIGNYMHGTAMQGGFRFQNTSGTPAVSHINRIIIANNWVDGSTNPSTYGIIIGGTSGVGQSFSMLVEGNWFANLGNGLGTVDGLGTDTGQYVILRNNFFAGPPADDVCVASDHLFIEGNTTLRTAWGRYGTYNNCGIDGQNVLAGTIYSNSGGGIGWRTKDSVEIVRGTTTAPQLIIWGVITAADTVTTYAFNPTGGTLNTGAGTAFAVHRTIAP